MSGIATHTLTILAQAATTQPAPPRIGDFFTSWAFPLMLMVVIFMIFSSGSRRKEQKQRQSMLDAMKRGDRVQTIGGILGTVVEVRDHEILLKVDESNNTKIKFTRSAISKVVTEEDKTAETK